MDLLSGGLLIVGAVPDSLCTNQLQAELAHFIGSTIRGRRLTATKDLRVSTPPNRREGKQEGGINATENH